MSRNITYTRSGDRVTLEMALQDYEDLTVIIGIAIGWGMQNDPAMGRKFVQFADDLNQTNPEYRPYLASRQ